MSELLFHVRNEYGPQSGDPPIVDGNDAGKLFGYLGGADGNQLIFVFDRATKTAELRCAEPGWTECIEVIDGVPVGFEMYFSNAERLWLTACWMSATASDVVPPACVPRVRFMCGSIDPAIVASLAASER